MHYRTNCKNDHPQTPSLLDRFIEALKTIYPHAKEDYFTGFSMPIELLKKHISIGCLKCELCNMENEKETCAVFAYTNFYMLIMDQEEDWGTKIHIFDISSDPYNKDKVPHIFNSGKEVLLENNHPTRRTKNWKPKNP